MDQNTTGALVVTAIAVLLIIAAAVAARNAAKERARRLAALRDQEVAIIVERTRMTPLGVICILVLVLSLVGSWVVGSKTTTVFQELEVGVSFIGTSVLLGIGILMGQRRTYTVYRPEARSLDIGAADAYSGR